MHLTERCQYPSDKKRPANLLGYDDSHKFYLVDECWIYFRNKRLPKTKQVDGWKFCLNINISDLDLAWHLIEPIILDPTHGILACKAIDLHNFNFDRWKHPTGRQIVIYTFKDELGCPLQQPEDLFSLLVKIESILRQHKIRADKSSNGSIKIKGSRYVSLRNDLNPEAQTYLSREEAIQKSATEPHNPFSQQNPYHNFTMQSNDQYFFHCTTHYASSKRGYRVFEKNEIIPIPTSSYNTSLS